ncbi:hypothetical protein ACMX2H_18970, partial [Arthrobacter sulfonylureivorans]
PGNRTTTGSSSTSAATTLEAGPTTQGESVSNTAAATPLQAAATTQHDTDVKNTVISGAATGNVTTQDTDASGTAIGEAPAGHTTAEEAATGNGATGNRAAGSSATGRGSCTCGGGNTTASVAVTAPLTTLLGLAEDPGELTGYGLMTPEMTRNLTALAKSWLTVLTDDYGQAIAAAKDLRTPPEWLKRL